MSSILQRYNIMYLSTRLQYKMLQYKFFLNVWIKMTWWVEIDYFLWLLFLKSYTHIHHTLEATEHLARDLLC